jgi:hypothetical protein
MLRRRFWLLLLGTSLVASTSVAACGGKGSGTGAGSTTTTGAGGGTGGGITGLGGSFLDGGGTNQTLDVEPSTLQTIPVVAGVAMPPIAYTATLSGVPVTVAWSVDRGDAATITPASGTGATFAPTGTAGGLVNVIASFNGMTVQRPVFMQLTVPSQSGPTAGESGQVVSMTSQLTAGGGVGGVGGEGLGPAVSNFPTTTMPAAMGLKFLYPYDKTVWPRGMLAPLLMWDWTPEDADAIQVSLQTTSGSFSWSGTFGRPIILGQAGAPSTFIRSPIPQDVWDMATNTAGGTTPNSMPDQLTVSLVVAKGGMAYGPISETWTVAPGRLAGTVYYNSYGTGLVQNSTDKDTEGNQYGAAVLAIKGGATGPVVVAGTPSGTDGTGCRVCHVVSGDGSRLTAQHGDVYQTTSSYDLKNGNAETVLTGYNSTFGWGGLYIDGSSVLTNVAQLAAGQPASSQMFAFPPTSQTPLPVTGIPSDLLAGAPAFSPDGKHVSFEFLGGTLAGLAGSASPSVLVSLDFDQATMSFGNLHTLATLPGGGSINGGGQNAGFPAFFPTNDAVVFHNQLSNPSGSHRYNTWQGATAQVWWSDLGTGTATPLATLNGFDLTSMASYLPTSASHADDTKLNYEPTVAPVVSGGYAWVVFTTRRLYGNLATIAPNISDPRTAGYDYQAYDQVTCKKLWVAAVDIGTIKNGTFAEGVPPGTDPSHPAFYLPGQELVAGNSRGFWVLDPCLANGASCMTGDQCCGGFCEPGDGGLVCGAPSGGCAGIQDKCTTAADCCDPDALCVNGFCALPQAQ